VRSQEEAPASTPTLLFEKLESVLLMQEIRLLLSWRERRYSLPWLQVLNE
jgi:hypothetical protein